MTTSWAFLTQGEWRSAIQANIGGVVLAGVTWIILPVTTLAAIYGRPVSNRIRWSIAVGLIGTILGSLVHWLIKLTESNY